jgi:hypothetical protein
MKIPQQLWAKLSPLVEAARGEPLVEPFVELEERPGRCLELVSPYGIFVFDREQRVVRHDGAVLCPFDAIQSVDIGAFPGGRGEKSWSVTLYRGIVDRTTVARTYDDGEASVVAARLARLLDCKVVSLVGRA